MSPSLANLFNLHACASLDKYLHLLEVIQGQPWRFEAESGRLIFGDAMSFQAQVLGYEAMDSQSWLWAWAETGVQLPEAVTKNARSLKVFGEKKDIPEFVSPQCPLNKINGEHLALVACGLFNTHAWFRGAYAGGAMLLTLQDPQFPTLQATAEERILSVFPRAVFCYELNHKQAFLAYTRHYRLEDFEENGVTVIAERKRELMEAEFDEQGNLLTLRSLLPKESPQPAGRPSERTVRTDPPKGPNLRPGQPKASGLRAAASRTSERKPGPVSERRSRYRQ